jgi:hypothetical protein
MSKTITVTVQPMLHHIGEPTAYEYATWSEAYHKFAELCTKHNIGYDYDENAVLTAGGIGYDYKITLEKI